MFSTKGEALFAHVAILIPFLTGFVFAAGSTGGGALDLYKRADYAGAIALLTRESPDAQNLELLGQCYYQQGELRLAVETLERAAALAPADSAIQMWLGRAWGGRAEMAFALHAFGYAQKAREAFESAVRLDPANAQALGDLFDFYVEAPPVVGGGIEKALSLIPQMEKCDPIGARVAWSRIHEERKQFEQAEADLREAIRLGPAQVNVKLDLARFLSRCGRYDDSEKAFERAAGMAPDSPRILFVRATAYINAGRNADQARDLLREYIAAKNLTPADPPVWEARRLLRKAKGL
jgi:tetratricopeptide (TPR) repeat protein